MAETLQPGKQSNSKRLTSK